MISGIIGGFIIVVVLGILINKKAMKKIAGVASAMLGKSAEKALEIDPVAVYKDRLEKASEELKGALTMLEEHSALIKKLKRKLETDQKEYTAVENYVKKHLDANDDAKASEFAEELVKLENSMLHTKERLESSERNYKLQAEKIKKLKETIIQYKEKASKLASDLQTSKAEAKIAELTQKFDSTSLGLDDLKEIEDVIENQIDRNESKSKVAEDLQVSNVRLDIEKEQKSARAKELMEKLRTPNKPT